MTGCRFQDAFSYQGLGKIYFEVDRRLKEETGSPGVGLKEGVDITARLVKIDVMICIPGISQVAALTTIVAGVLLINREENRRAWTSAACGLFVRGALQGLNLGPLVLLVNCVHSAVVARKNGQQTFPEKNIA